MWRILIIGLILLLLFGGKRFGALGKGLGEGIRNFKKALGDKPLARRPVEPSGRARPTEPPILTQGESAEPEEDPRG